MAIGCRLPCGINLYNIFNIVKKVSNSIFQSNQALHEKGILLPDLKHAYCRNIGKRIRSHTLFRLIPIGYLLNYE